MKKLNILNRLKRLYDSGYHICRHRYALKRRIACDDCLEIINNISLEG